MANFTALKTAINNAIKTNGNEEITGAILQAILDAMVETLGDSAINDLENAITTEVTNRENAVGGVAADLAAEALARANKDNQLDGRINQEEYNRQNADAALSQTMSQGFQTLGSQMTALNAAISALNAAYQNGYLYGGIATPSSSPSNNKCFYIALQGGTYTNFGGVGVVEGINIIKNDSGWKVEHIYDQTTLLNEFYLLRQQVIQAITSFTPIVIEGDVTNAPDEEDLTSNANHLLQFKNNAYSPLEFSGLGRKYLRKNIAPLSESAPFNGFVEGVNAEETLSGTPTQIFWDRMNTRFVGIKDGIYYAAWTDDDNYVPVSTSLVYMYNGTPYQWTGSDFIVDETEVPNLVNCLTQDMINEANTIYIIRYDYTLKEDITIPANCVLEFDGGSISGAHTITGTYTGIQAGLVKIFSTDVTLAGSWNVAEAYPEWFGASVNLSDNANQINAAIKFLSIKGGTLYLSEMYKTTGTIYLRRSVYLKGKGGNEGAVYEEIDYCCGISFYDTTGQKWAIDTMGPNSEILSYNTPFVESKFTTTTPEDPNADIKLEDFEVQCRQIGTMVSRFGAIRIIGSTPIRMNNIRVTGSFKYGIFLSCCYGVNLTNVHSFAINIPIIMYNVTTSLLLNCVWQKYTNGEQFDTSMIPSDALPPYVSTPKHCALLLLYSRVHAINSVFEGNDAALYGIKYHCILDNAYYELGNPDTIAYGKDCYLYQKGNVHPDVIITKYYTHGITLSKKYNVSEFGVDWGMILEDISVGYLYINNSSYIGDVSPIKVVCNTNMISKNTAISYYDDFVINEGIVSYILKNKGKFVPMTDVYITAPMNNEIPNYSNYWSTRENQLGTPRFPTIYSEICKREEVNNCRIHALYNIANKNCFGGQDVIKNKHLKITCDDRAWSAGNRTLYLADSVCLNNSELEFECSINMVELVSAQKAAFKVSGTVVVEFKDSYDFNIYNVYSIFELYGTQICNIKLITNREIYVDSTCLLNPTFTTPYLIEIYNKNGALFKRLTNTVRPTTNVPIGYMYMENNKPIWYIGNNTWVDATGATV